MKPTTPATAPAETGRVSISARLPHRLRRRAERLGRVLPGGKSMNQMIIDALEAHIAALEQRYGLAPDD